MLKLKLYYHLTAALLLFWGWFGHVQAEVFPEAPAASEGRVMLPQEHEYQKVLRNYLGTFKEADFDHGVDIKELSVAEGKITDMEYLYRTYLMTLMQQPMVGFKRGIPAVNAPAWLFLLNSIEGPETAPDPEVEMARYEPLPGSATIRPGPVTTPTGIVVPPVWPETLVAFTEWDYPGNAFYNNSALKRRAFVTAVVRMIMADDFLTNEPLRQRSDWNGYRLVMLGSTYLGVRDMLPPLVQKAYKTGLLRLGNMILDWGVKGEEPNLDLIAPVGLWYISQACNDPEFTERAEDYARTLMSDPRYFHPAGYWVERGGGLDVGFAGMTNNFAILAALASDWPFAKAAVTSLYRLRSHLILPDPDGSHNGPSHFNTRLGDSANADQWDWNGARDHAALMITDEAAHAVRIPDQEELEDAPAKRISGYNSQIYGPLRNPYNSFVKFVQKQKKNFGYVQNEDLRGSTWKWRLWLTYNFPLSINPGYEFYRPGSYAKLMKLQKLASPMLKLPVERGKTYLRNFTDAFFATRQKKYAAIMHTGPVGLQPQDDGLVDMPPFMGFGGGQLSAFWTPETGSVLLSQRHGMSFGSNNDTLDIWRNWPIHAVTGTTRSGMVFSSSRIVKPEVQSRTGWLRRKRGSITVNGTLPNSMFGQETELKGCLEYQRNFTILPGELRVQTGIRSDGADEITELYETLPVYLKDHRSQKDLKPTVIEFRSGNDWLHGSTEPMEQVNAIRLKRFSSAVEISFAAPQRVKLTPENPQMRNKKIRNILIDLLDSPENGSGYKVSYVIRPVSLK